MKKQIRPATSENQTCSHRGCTETAKFPEVFCVEHLAIHSQTKTQVYKVHHTPTI